MAEISNIEWTEATWNPVTGCTKVSSGCKNCYAEKMALRLKAMGHPRYRSGFKLKIHPSLLEQPLHWSRPRLVFVNSMSDLFHENVPFSFIARVFESMKRAHWHTFQILTKRAERLGEFANDLPWPHNIWAGVTIENEQYISRLRYLQKVPAAVKFLSLEPLLGPIDTLDLISIDWVITGGESGPRAREVKVDWVRKIRDQCVSKGVAFFFKQWGGYPKSKTGRKLDGQTWNEMPIARDKILGNHPSTYVCGDTHPTT